MKRILLSFLCMSLLPGLIAQNINKNTALELLSKHTAAVGLTSQDLDNSIVQNAYTDKGSGAIMIYLQQSYKGIPVYNQLQVICFKNDRLVSNSGGRIMSIEKLSGFGEGIPAVTAESAVLAAASDRKLKLTVPPMAVNRKLGGQLVEFDKLGISREPVTARLMWVPTDQAVRLAWQVYIVQNNSSDYWQVRVDAQNSHILDVSNLTVYCNWDDPNHDKSSRHQQHTSNKPLENKLTGNLFFENKTNMVPGNRETTGPAIINSASYRVVPYPAESPNHPGGAHALRTDPWSLSPGNASSLKWHSDGVNDYNYTRGNNVWAQEDRNGNNGTGIAAISTTPDPLTFDFTPDYSVTPIQTAPVPNQQFNTTNLFYWNNIMHDIAYVYGFDEVAANFQANNQGRGGNQNDQVNADAQDGAGSNNANFSTPADGSSGRMQMFLWNGSPQKDGDVDNGVIAHEYTHGISNRLTGGGSGGCLGNGEHMGEGWSDYYSLMVTHDWSTAGLNDGFTNPRGIGTYVMGQAITGPGIRSQRYCTNLAVNSRSYTASISTSSHSRGEIWCATLWDMTWNIIQQAGTINPNLFNIAGGGGNSIALRLVTQGMKMQPCSPGFLDGRNAILAADQLLYGGQYRCAIIQAFARRGMGFDAKQGSSNSVTDQVPGFSTTESILTLTQNLTQQEEGLNITYTNTVTAGACGAISNFVLTDTLPSNVTYVSGGTYNAVTRVVSFNVNIASGSSQAYSFTVQINNGSYFPTVNLFEDAVTGSPIPAIWTTSSTTSTNWDLSTARSHSAPASYFSSNLDVASDQRLFSTNTIALGANPPPLSFWHYFTTEATYDGGIMEISTDGGTNWADLGPNIITNGYNSVFGTGTLLQGRQAWTGNSNGFIKTTINLVPFANQSVKFRFRFLSDVGTKLEGWYVDDIAIKSQAIVEMKSNLFNNTGTRLNVADTFTIILPPVVGCSNVGVITQPVSSSACTGTDASFTVSASGSTPGYQWQVSTNGCSGPFTDIPAANGATLTLANVTAGMNNNVYRVLVNNSCPSSFTSACAILTVNSVAAITTQPENKSTCAGNNTSFSIAASGTGLGYQWQVSTNGGGSFSNIPAATGTTLNIAPVTSNLNNNQYRVLVSSTCSAAGSTSNIATLTVFDPVQISSSPANFNGCAGSAGNFSVTATGTGISYQWQQSNNAGVSYTDIPGATAASYPIPNLSVTMNNNLYRVIVTGVPCGAVTSSAATLLVKAAPTVELTGSMYTSLTPYMNSTLYTTVSPVGRYAYQWFRDGVLLPNITGSSIPVNVDGFGTYKVVITDSLNGCTDTSGLVRIRDIASGTLFIYPNPGPGLFQVRYYSAANSAEVRILNIYDARGARVYSRSYPIGQVYEKMDADLRRAASGVYMVELLSANGERLATGRLVKQ